jgi:hypothetical protein
MCENADEQRDTVWQLAWLLMASGAFGVSLAALPRLMADAHAVAADSEHAVVDRGQKSRGAPFSP